MKDFTSTLNEWGRNQVPFLFIIDFELRSPLAFPLKKIDPAHIVYDFHGLTNSTKRKIGNGLSSLKKFPISFEEYQSKFDLVQRHLHYGDTFLTNLTLRTKIELEHSLMEVFHHCDARYKLCMKDRFLVFSPETFVRIQDGKIFSYPMKGTIDANLPNAAESILNDGKEMAEHVTIVDLVRNDLSTVSTNVQVSRFRYIDEIRTSHKNLLQVSSEIKGDLSSDYEWHIGDILVALLPAGSVSGAPKPKTLDIIRRAEGHPRHYFTGVCGIFDGQVLDSAVMIRFIEQDGDNYYYRSGGGITANSEVRAEFQEAIDKVYIPLG